MQFLRFIVLIGALIGASTACQSTPEPPTTQQPTQPAQTAQATPPPRATSVATVVPTGLITVTTISPTPSVEPDISVKNLSLNYAAHKPATALTAVYHLPINADTVGAKWFIGSYVDMDKAKGIATDFMGGFMTYDGHQGTDFFIRDFEVMDTGVPVTAAREGIVAALHDGESDLSWGKKERQPNYVKVVHADGSTAYYSHLRQNSIIVSVGEQINVGQSLGLIGNSGSSSSHPHLHFEVYDENGRLLDIFHEGMAAFDPAYPNTPVIFATGITTQDDPYLFADLSRYTPSHNPIIPCTESPYIWYKVIRMGENETLHTLIIHPDGHATALTPITADQNYRYAYWHVYSNPLPSGNYRVISFFNNGSTYASEMALSVTCY